jgi:hypothetical protein
MFNPKKILAATMLFCFAAPIFFLVAFFIKQQYIQHEMREKLEYASLQTITIKRAAFKWVKKDQEIIVNGELFDVESIIINENDVIVTGLFDDDENKLEQVFSSVMQLQKNETAPINKLVLKFILTPFSLKNHLALIPTFYRNQMILYRHFDETLISQFYPIKTPPPIIEFCNYFLRHLFYRCILLYNTIRSYKIA